MRVEVRSLYFRHNEGGREILRDVSFCAPGGSITVVLGPNGSGKSTLFRCITGLWKPFRGEVFVEDRNTQKMSFRERARLFAMVPQDHHPPFPYRVFDVVLMGRASYVGMFSSPKKEDYEAAEQAISTVGIGHIKDKPYTKISGGERQLVLIARALAQASPVIIFDEPTSHLDFRNQLKVLTTIRSISRERQATVLVTLHDPNLSMLFADYTVVIHEGSVVASGPPGEVVTEDLIRKIYGVETRVLSWNGAKLVCPIVKAG